MEETLTRKDARPCVSCRTAVRPMKRSLHRETMRVSYKTISL